MTSGTWLPSVLVRPACKQKLHDIDMARSRAHLSAITRIQRRSWLPRSYDSAKYKYEDSVEYSFNNMSYKMEETRIRNLMHLCQASEKVFVSTTDFASIKDRYFA